VLSSFILRLKSSHFHGYGHYPFVKDLFRKLVLHAKRKTALLTSMWGREQDVVQIELPEISEIAVDSKAKIQKTSSLSPVNSRMSRGFSDLAIPMRRVSSPQLLINENDDDSPNTSLKNDQSDESSYNDYEQPVRVRYTILRKFASKRFTLFLDQRFPSDDQEEDFLIYFYGAPQLKRMKVLAFIALVYLLLRYIQQILFVTASSPPHWLGLIIYRGVFYLLLLVFSIPIFANSIFPQHKSFMEFCIFILMCLYVIGGTTQWVLFYGSSPGAIPVTITLIFILCLIRIRTYYSYLIIPLAIVNFLLAYLIVGYVKRFNLNFTFGRFTPNEIIYLSRPTSGLEYDWLNYNQSIIRCVFYVTLLAIAITFQYIYSYYMEKYHRNQYLAKRALKQDARALRREKQRSSLLFSNIVPKYFIDKIFLDGRLNRAELFRNGSVLISDVISFRKILNKKSMTLSSSSRNMTSVPMDPPEILNALNFHFTHFDVLTQRLKLQRVKTVGDHYICIGGLRSKQTDEQNESDDSKNIEPPQYDNHLERIVEMGLRMVGATKVLNKRHNWQLELHVGIATGQICASVMGKSRVSFDCMGRAVMLANLMQRNSLPSNVRVTERVVRNCIQSTDKFKFFPQNVIIDPQVGRIHSSFVTASKALRINAGEDLHLFEGEENADEAVLPNAIIDEEVLLEEHRIRGENRVPRKASEDVELEDVLSKEVENAPDEVIVDDDDDDEAREADLESYSGSRKRSNDPSSDIRRGGNMTMNDKDAPIDVSLPEEQEPDKTQSLSHASKSFGTLRALQSQESIRIATMRSFEQDIREQSPSTPSEKPSQRPFIDNLPTRSVFVLMMIDPKLALQYTQETYPNVISFIRAMLIVILLFHIIAAGFQASLFPYRYGFHGTYVASVNTTVPSTISVSTNTNASAYTPVITIYVAIALHLLLVILYFSPLRKYLMTYICTIIALFIINLWICISFIFDAAIATEIFVFYIHIWAFMIIGLFPLIPIVIRFLMYMGVIAVYYSCLPSSNITRDRLTSIPAVLLFLAEILIFLIANGYNDIASISYWRVKSQVETENSRVALERQWNDSLLLSVMPETIAKEFKGVDQLIENESVVIPNKDGLLFNQVLNGCVCFVQVVGVNDMIIGNQNIHLMMRFLFDMFDAFDSMLIEKKGNNQVCKIKSIGDTFVCASGIHATNQVESLTNMANIVFKFNDEAIKIMQRQRYAPLRNRNELLGIRIGISYGDYIGCVLGQRFFQFDIFGDTVVQAKRMCLTGPTNRIHITPNMAKALLSNGLAKEKNVEILQVGSTPESGDSNHTCHFVVERNGRNDKILGYWLETEIDHG
jgi:class 3 adenylate cyclase